MLRPLSTASILLCLAMCFLIVACGVSHNGRLSGYFAKGRLDQHFTGFHLFDPEKDEVIFQYQDDKYYTPASNTKILTLYTALQNLPDSLCSFAYLPSPNKYYVWGMGDPTILHPDFPANDLALKKLAALPADTLILCTNHWSSEKYGPGWAWDDYAYAYQTERSHLPLYGNLVWFHADTMTNQFSYTPNYLPLDIRLDSILEVNRAEQSNIFQLRLPEKMPSNFDFAIPWQTSDTMIARILGEEIDKVVVNCSSCADTIPKQATIISGIPADTVYSYYMKYSDNFIAEQLLLMSSAQKFGRMDARQIIEAMLEDQLAEIRSELQWYDGSGLSRYNLFTPHSMAYVLQKIYDTIGWAGVKRIFAAGGQSGTISSWYAGESEPYVYAKTGTLRNKHCLSGYLKTDKGRTLIFSFMHNHYVGSSSPVKESMQEVLSFLKTRY